MGGYTKNNMFGLKIEYHLLVEKCLEWIIEQAGMTAILIPHVYGSRESDLSACRLVYNKMKERYGDHLHLIDKEFNQHEIKYHIGQMDIFIGSRMHACIAALSQCVPVAGIAYSPKFLGVFKSIGMEELVIDVTKPGTIETVTESLANILEKRDEIRFRLKKEIEQINSQMRYQFKMLLNDVSQSNSRYFSNASQGKMGARKNGAKEGCP
ncbi:MAG TPA: polysaccharide pyruvyl transferase family protein, partial [Chitinispirillaceae bacterium]|nr:polysaccharide pyruvyl transferase family protein [Chitinispirillaceae bacterium]